MSALNPSCTRCDKVSRCMSMVLHLAEDSDIRSVAIGADVS
jgi:hypothetical protein